MKTKAKPKTKNLPKRLEVSRQNAIKESKRKCMTALVMFKKCGVMTKSAKAAGMTRATLKKYLNQYPKFAAAWEDAYEEYLDSLEEVADYRARAYSDKLLQFLLTGGRKTKYGTAVNVSATSSSELKIDPESILTLASEMAKRLDNKVRHNIPVIEAEYKIVGDNDA